MLTPLHEDGRRDSFEESGTARGKKRLEGWEVPRSTRSRAGAAFPVGVDLLPDRDFIGHDPLGRDFPVHEITVAIAHDVDRRPRGLAETAKPGMRSTQGPPCRDPDRLPGVPVHDGAPGGEFSIRE